MRKYTEEEKNPLLQDMPSAKNLYLIFFPIPGFPKALSMAGLKRIAKQRLMTHHISVLQISIS